MKNILQLGNPVLRKPSSKVTEITDGLITNTKRMALLLQLSKGLGLAAPQVGLSQSYFIYNFGNGFKTIINPEIVEQSDSKVLLDEGCLSIKGYSFMIERHEEVTIKYLDTDGNDQYHKADGVLGQLFQHEVDHLDGILITDRLPAEDAEKFIAKWKRRKK